MNIEIEKKIINNFVIKHKRNRISHELLSKKKRRNALSRFSDYNRLFDTKYIIEIPKPNSDYIQIYEFIKRYYVQEECYVFAYNENLNSDYVNLKDALKEVVGNGMPALVSCIPDKLVYYEGEQGLGAPIRLLLYKN